MDGQSTQFSAVKLQDYKVWTMRTQWYQKATETWHTTSKVSEATGTETTDSPSRLPTPQLVCITQRKLSFAGGDIMRMTHHISSAWVPASLLDLRPEKSFIVTSHCSRCSQRGWSKVARTEDVLFPKTRFLRASHSSLVCQRYSPYICMCYSQITYSSSSCWNCFPEFVLYSFNSTQFMFLLWLITYSTKSSSVVLVQF